MRQCKQDNHLSDNHLSESFLVNHLSDNHLSESFLVHCASPSSCSLSPYARLPLAKRGARPAGGRRQASARRDRPLSQASAWSGAAHAAATAHGPAAAAADSDDPDFPADGGVPPWILRAAAAGPGPPDRFERAHYRDGNAEGEARPRSAPL